MICTIKDDRLSIDGRPAPFVSTPNEGGRIEPHFIVLHDTSDRLKPDDTISWFRNPKARVSAHFVVARDGAVTQMVECDRCAWHAGKSSWAGFKNLNAWSIGIEIDNPGKLTRKGDRCFAWFGDSWPVAECVEHTTTHHGHGWWLPYTSEQIAAVKALVLALASTYPKISEAVGHYHISPGRKVDVGPQFPYADVAALVPIRGAPSSEAIEMVQRRLLDLGYQPGSVDGIDGPKTREAIRQFEEQNGLHPDGLIDERLKTALLSGAPKGPVTAPRETATKADVAASSQTMRAAGHVKRGTEIGAAANVVDALTSPVPVADAVAVSPADIPGAAVGALSQAGDMLGHVETAQGMSTRLSGVIDWAISPAGAKFALVSIILAAIWIGANRVEVRRWLDYRLGRHNGGA